MNRLPGLNSSIPTFFKAPLRGLKEQRPVQPLNLIIPGLKKEVFSLPNVKYSSTGSQISRHSIQTIYETLRQAGESVLSNDDAFKVISFQITNPANYDQYQKLVNVGTELAIQSGNFRSGYVQRLTIQKDSILAEVNEVLKNKISFGDKIFIMELEGFDLIILAYDEAAQTPILELVPTFMISEDSSPSLKNLRIGFDILEDGETVFVDSVEFNDLEYRVGVAFVRPEESEPVREQSIWFTPTDRDSFELAN